MRKVNTMKIIKSNPGRSTILAFVATMLLAQGGAAWAGGAAVPTVEQLAIESITTPEQHAAMAAFFRSKAAEARAVAARHEAMGRAYDNPGRPKPGSAVMRGHCERLVKSAQADAAVYEQMAAEHAALAGKAGGE